MKMMAAETATDQRNQRCGRSQPTRPTKIAPIAIMYW